MDAAGQRPDPSRYQLIPRTLIFARRRNRILLQQVPPDRGGWAGLWNGPGGHVERGESPLAAARREFLEETGLTLESPRLAGTLVVDLEPGPGLVLFVFAGRAGSGRPTPGPEGPLAWFRSADIPALPTVADLPSLLPRCLAVLDGADPFTGRSSYDASGRLQVILDPVPAARLGRPRPR